MILNQVVINFYALFYQSKAKCHVDITSILWKTPFWVIWHKLIINLCYDKTIFYYKHLMLLLRYYVIYGQRGNV